MKVAWFVLVCALAAIPASAQTVTRIPLIQKDGMVYVRARIDGLEVWAMLDSGSNQTVVDDSVVSSHGCKKATLLGAGGGESTSCKKDVEVLVYGLVLSTHVFIAKLPSGIKALIPLNQLAPGGTVTFDYRNSQILITRKN